MARFLIVFAIAIAVGVAWYVGARSVALWTEVFDTEDLGSKDVAQIGWNGTYLLVDSQILDLSAPGNSQAMQLSVDAQHRLVASVGGKTIVLGAARGTMPDAQEPLPAFAVAPGDRATLSRARSRLMWPNWFETNFMTGNSPSWKRFSYFHLVVRKASGATLDLFWRFEQWYYPSDRRWLAPDMVGKDFCGLVRASLQ